MPDVFTKAKRSDVMSRIRSRGNKDTELALVRVFRAHGITGWRRHIQIRIAERGTRNDRGVRAAGSSFRVPPSALSIFSVRPDFVFPRLKLAVFVDGCFWHGCPQHGTRPKGNAAFWRRKFAANIARDRLVTRTLRRAGWRVLRIWEHTLRWATRKRGGRNAERGMGRLVGRLQNALASSRRPAPRTARRTSQRFRTGKD
jgi:DNA mismatch endonuclease, patch repair protein